MFFYYSNVKKKEIRNNWRLTLLPQGMSRFSKKKLKEIKKKRNAKHLERQGFLYLENFFLIFKKEIIEKALKMMKLLEPVALRRFFTKSIILNYII